MREHPWAAKWRPVWGFVSAVAFGLYVLVILALLVYAVAGGQPEMVNSVVAAIYAAVPLFGIPGAICGVSAWDRGKEKRILAQAKIKEDQQPCGD